MTKKNWMLIAAVAVLAGIYVVCFTNWLKPQIIEIHHISRDMWAARRPPGMALPPALPVTFGFEQAYKFTEIKVVPLAAWQTNKSALPIWHLITSSNSIPLNRFIYGQYVRGMKPAVPGMRPEQLQPGVAYRLFVTAGSAKGQHDFQPLARSGK